MNAPLVHHLHFNCSAPAVAAKWYAAQFGLRAICASPAEGESSGSGRELWAAVPTNANGHQAAPLLWSQARKVESSVGTTLDHFGWSVEDLDADTERLVQAGCELVGEPVTIGPSATGESLRISFLVDPFGAKLELVEDSDLLGLHHIHLLTPNVDADREQWLSALGGEALTFKGFLPGIRYPNLWVLYRPSETSLSPTAGRAIDHLAFASTSASDLLARLQERAIRTTGPSPSHGGRTVGFAEIGTGSSGAVTIEVVEEPAKAHGNG